MGAQPELKVPLKDTAAARDPPVSGTSSSASRSSASVPELGGDSPVPVSSSSASVLELGGDSPVPGSSSSASVPELPELKVPLKVPLKDTAAALPAKDPAGHLAVALSTVLPLDLKDTAAALPAKDFEGLLAVVEGWM